KEIIVYPTDTLYGFGVDATCEQAVKDLNALKGRSQPMSIVVPHVDAIGEYADVNEELLDQLRSLFPGPYTALLPKINGALPPEITLDSPKIGIRIPNHFFPMGIVKALGKPITTTSINRHGNAPLNTAELVAGDFPQIEIFEDTVLRESLGSTIVDFTQGKPVIIRKGDGEFPL
ncbi:MAG: threonylcarbamoyl-AMP synthase, partial [FCB group bacterium]|nr:threonylcarbamoyl-AMP synthase [FCB group bacterium]